MQITVLSHDDSDDDCKRETYYTIVDGKNHLLAPCALGSYWNHLEILQQARTLFGADVEVVYGPDTFCQTEKPGELS